MNQLPETGFLELPQIIGQEEITEEQAEHNRLAALEAKRNGKKPNTKPKRSKKQVPPIIPVGKSTWWEGVGSGRFPQPIRIGRRTLWRVEDIRTLIANA